MLHFNSQISTQKYILEINLDLYDLRNMSWECSEHTIPFTDVSGMGNAGAIPPFSIIVKNSTVPGTMLRIIYKSYVCITILHI